MVILTKLANSLHNLCACSWLEGCFPIILVLSSLYMCHNPIWLAFFAQTGNFRSFHTCFLQLGYILHLFLSWSDCFQPSGCCLVVSTLHLFRHVHSATAHKLVTLPEKEERLAWAAGRMPFQPQTEGLLTACFQLRHSVKRESTRAKSKRWGERFEERETNRRCVGGKIGNERRRRGCVSNWEERQGVEKGKPCASPPAGRSKSNSWLAADTGAQSVFIGLQDFNPQYWPKPLAEGWQPCLQQTINHLGGEFLHILFVFLRRQPCQFLHVIMISRAVKDVLILTVINTYSQCAGMTLVHTVCVKIIRFIKTGIVCLEGSFSESHLWQQTVNDSPCLRAPEETSSGGRGW